MIPEYQSQIKSFLKWYTWYENTYQYAPQNLKRRLQHPFSLLKYEPHTYFEFYFRNVLQRHKYKITFSTKPSPDKPNYPYTMMIYIYQS